MIDTPTTACARYGTGDFLKLNQRQYSTSIELIPCGEDFLKVVWNIGNDSHVFWASSAVGDQFSSFVKAIYALYAEGPDGHERNHHAIKNCHYYFHSHDPSIGENEIRVETELAWNGEGPYYQIKFCRIGNNHWKEPVLDGDDPITVQIENEQHKRFFYTIDGHELCYAVSKAITNALKTYGFYGYFFSTGGDCCVGDILDLHMILFLKAYALNVMEVRKLSTVWDNGLDHAEGTPFEKEIELLLFEM